MSRYLAPIHYWLFNQIDYHEELELRILHALETTLKVDLSSLHAKLKDTYGSLLENKPLEFLINQKNIHGWLQNKVAIAETRQAALITEVVNTYGKSALSIINQCYVNQGVIYGTDASHEYDVSNAIGLYESLNDYILEGMPCDDFSHTITNTELTVYWKLTKNPHKKYWDKASGNVVIFYELRNVLIASFIKTANKDFEFQGKYVKNHGEYELHYEIKKVSAKLS